MRTQRAMGIGDPPELAILIGLQASGKSTFRRMFLDATHEVVSKDLLRNNRRPAARQRVLVREGLSRGLSVVVDNTNPSRAERADLIAIGRASGARVTGYYLACSRDESVSRNAARSGRERVPDVAIFATLKRFERPTRTEGFDALHFVTATDGAFVVVPFREVSDEDR